MKNIEILISVRLTELQTPLPISKFQRQGISAIQNNREVKITSATLVQIDGKPKPNNGEPNYPTSNSQSNGHERGLSKPMLMEFSGELFDFIAHQLRLSDTEKTALSEGYSHW